jgi:aquaporin Z
VIFSCRRAMLRTLKDHWPEYLIEAWCLGTFMVSACLFGVAIYHSGSPVVGAGWFVQNIVMGIIMGATAVGIICSPWGKRSGAHFNPAVTLTFFRLGKVGGTDAVFYIAAHFAGGVAGVLLSWTILGGLLEDSAVNFVVTVPGEGYGVGAALAAEVIISFIMMTMILFTSNSARASRLTPYLAGIFVAAFIAVESPVSGMSMNPARTVASSAVSSVWVSWWVYFAAPGAAMLAAAELFVRTRGLQRALCAKLHHRNPQRCIFNCSFDEMEMKSIEVTRQPRAFSTPVGLF